MSGPYTKKEYKDAWKIEDGDGQVIATTETETLADYVMAALLGYYKHPPDYEVGKAYAVAEPDDDNWYCQSCGHRGTGDDFLSSEVDDLYRCPKCGNAEEVFPGVGPGE